MHDPSLLRLAHSVLWPGFDGLTAPDWLMHALDQGLAGAVYFEQNISPSDPEQVRALSKSIHDANPIALIGVDEEGGIVTRLEASTGSSTPGNAVLGRIDDVDITEHTAAWIGNLVGAAGIDINLAPTVDVNSNPRNPVIGVRSFSADTDVVSRHAAAYVRGIQSAGIAACPKHFPGHGDTMTDSHLDVATSDITLEELRSIHLPPFRAAIDAGAKALMSAHIRVPALGDAPATLNSTSLGIARELGFDGVLITDAVDMAAIRATVGSGQGAVAALGAGADLICIGNPGRVSAAGGPRIDELDFTEPLHAVYDALASGTLSMERVEEAAARNAALALWRHEQPASPDDAGVFDGAPLAARAADVIGDVRLARGTVTLIDARPRRSIAVGDAPDFFDVALREFLETDRVPLGGLSDADAVAKARTVLADRPGEVVLVVNQPQNNTSEASVLDAVLQTRPNTVVIYAGWPAKTAPAAGRAIVTYGASRATARNAARLLSGQA
ncbi:glycoside hydrolase family 3 protein [Microbacterium sp. A84]|uniref:glycoside hydrolase family 3 protein n=1 Tax=Microbacterium sp. A84 TaxID=3450715 RepID=UPI003F444C94